MIEYVIGKLPRIILLQVALMTFRLAYEGTLKPVTSMIAGFCDVLHCASAEEYYLGKQALDSCSAGEKHLGKQAPYGSLRWREIPAQRIRDPDQSIILWNKWMVSGDFLGIWLTHF